MVLVDCYQPITRLFFQPTHLNLRRTKKKPARRTPSLPVEVQYREELYQLNDWWMANSPLTPEGRRQQRIRQEQFEQIKPSLLKDLGIAGTAWPNWLDFPHAFDWVYGVDRRHWQAKLYLHHMSAVSVNPLRIIQLVTTLAIEFGPPAPVGVLQLVRNRQTFPESINAMIPDTYLVVRDFVHYLHEQGVLDRDLRTGDYYVGALGSARKALESALV